MDPGFVQRYAHAHPAVLKVHHTLLRMPRATMLFHVLYATIGPSPSRPLLSNAPHAYSRALAIPAPNTPSCCRLWDGLRSMGLKPFVEKDEDRLITVNTIKVRCILEGRL